MRAVFYVDGFNLYHGLRAKHGRRYHWLDLQALAQLMRQHDEVLAVRYFTAIVKGEPDAARRQEICLGALAQHCPAVTIHRGHFKPKTPRGCRHCGEPWQCQRDPPTRYIGSVDADVAAPAASVSGLYAFLHARGDVTTNPVPRRLPTRRERQRPRQGVPLVRGTRTLPRILTPSEVDALTGALRSHRERAMVAAMVLGRCGCHHQFRCRRTPATSPRGSVQATQAPGVGRVAAGWRRRRRQGRSDATHRGPPPSPERTPAACQYAVSRRNASEPYSIRVMSLRPLLSLCPTS